MWPPHTADRPRMDAPDVEPRRMGVVGSRTMSAGELSGRRALVTGAASGIGRACAARLVAAGAKVVAADRDADALAALDMDVEPVVVDLADLDAIDRLDLAV